MRTLFIACVLLFTCSQANSFNDPDKEEALIREVLMDYIEGTANGEPERLKRAFHPDFNLYSTTENDELRIWEGEDYISRIQPGKKANRIGRIISVDYEGIAATAKVEIVVPGWRVFTDYFLLVKYQENWKIVHKSYSWRPFEEEDKLAMVNVKLDSIFTEVDRPDHPAVTALAIHKGEVVYKKAFGSTNLDHQIPATVHTKFQLAALSRHFTAFALLMLEEEGKLSLEDDIRKYLPQLPEYERPITIDHLLSMTSGLSDFWPMSDLIGLHEEDVLTQEQVLNTIGKLKPVFKPGEDYIYGHSDQVLLAEIIAKASGNSFADYMKKALFEPLGMNNTEVRTAHHQLIDGLAESYMSTEAGFRRSVINFGVYGPINVYSTVDDLAKWELNLLNPKVGSKALVDKLLSPAKLSNGNYIDSWFGRFTYGQQFYHWGHGVDEIYQMGVLGGHTSSMFKFPDQEFTVIVLGSGMPYSGYLGMGLAEHFIGEEIDPEVPTAKVRKLSVKNLERFAGRYWDEKLFVSRTIEVQDDTLRYVRGNGRSSALLPISDNRFRMSGREDVFATFIEKNQKMMMEMESASLHVSDFEQVDEITYTVDQLESFSGSYFNKLHNIVYDLEVENGQLVALHPRVGRILLTPVKEKVFEANRWFFGSIKFDENGRGFTLNSENAKRLRFEKI
ncbi:MAG: hypothetical protein Tsb0034_07210 [Ekhidna sp.]